MLLPILVVAGAWTGLRRTPDVHGYAAVFDEKLAEARQPEVVVLGSSLANRGIDLDVLARELGVRRNQIVLLQLPHAEAAHWYAILKNRVFAGGYRPKLVILAGAMTTMLNHELLAEQLNVDRLMEQLTEDEPVIARKVFGMEDTAGFTSRFLRERASLWRSALLDGVRDRVVALFFTRRHRVEEGSRLAEKVNESVFANDRMDYDLHAAAPTGVGLTASTAAFTVSADAFDLRGTALLDDVQALAEAHGSRVVWVRMPFPPSNATMDAVPPDIEADALAWLEELGSGWLDLRTLDLTDADFEDMRHLSRRGAVTFTTALARALVGLGALDPEGTVAVVRGLAGVAAPERLGELPPLPAPKGQGCRREAPAGALAAFDDVVRAGLAAEVVAPFEVLADGRVLPAGDVGRACGGAWSVRDGRLVVEAPSAEAEVEVRWGPVTWTPTQGGAMAWVLPGTTVRWSVSQGWTLPQRAFRVVARGVAVGPGAPRATVAVNGEALPLTALGGRVLGVFRPAPPTAAWTLEASVPRGAPAVLLHHLAVGRPPTTTAVLGAGETLYGASVRVVGGKLEDTKSHADYDAPPSIEGFRPRLEPGPRNLAKLVVPALTELADAPDQDMARPSECSPVRVLEDGVPLPHPHTACFDVLAKGGGRYCHAGHGFWITAPDDSDPAANGRTYTLALDQDRSCATWVQRGATTLRGSWWLYPGDVASFDVPPERLRAFRDGPNALAVEVVPLLKEPTEPLRVELFVDGRTVLDTTWLPPSKTGRQRTAVFPLDPPLPASVGSVRLRLTNPSGDTFHLVTMASLAEAYGSALDDPPEAAAPAAAAPTRAPARWGREGTPAPLPPLQVRGELEPGVVDSRLFPLWPISQTALVRRGLGAWSPLRLKADGVDLQPVSDRKRLRDCDACYLHTGQAVLVHAPGATEAALAARLDDAFPSRLDGGGEAWWLYPGTTGWVELEDLRGDDVQVTVRAIGLHPQRDQAGRDLLLRVGGAEALLEPTEAPGVVTATLHARPVGGRVRVEVADRSERGFALIADVTVTDAAGPGRVLPSQGPITVNVEADVGDE